MKIFYRCFFTFFVAFLLVACGGGGTDSGGGPAPTPEPDSDGPKKIVAIGDSIGNGFGIATPWPVRLAGIVNREVVNNSVSNEQTSFGVANIQALITQNSPSHVFILLGTNNAIRGSVSGAIADLQTMVDIARRNNVIVVVGTLPPITRSASENRRVDAINRGIRQLDGARLAPVRGMFGDGRNNLDGDGVHPNDQGQQAIAEAFATQF